MVFDLNQPPLPSPRGTMVDDDDDDVMVIEPPPASLPPRKRRGSGFFTGGGSSSSRQVRDEVDKDSDQVSVVCSKCQGVSKVKFLGTEEERRVWKCFKCLLKHGEDERPGRSGGASGSLDLLDINSSPPSEGEADGAYARPVADVYRRSGDGTHSGKAPVPVFSSSPGHRVDLSSISIHLPFPENRSNLQKAPQNIGIGKSGSDGIIKHQEPVTVKLNEIHKNSAAVGAVQGKQISSIESYLRTPKNVYLQGLKDYISERKGILSDGWRVEFEFSSNRIRTFAVYINADGRRFVSMPEVAHHLGLPSTIHPLQSEYTTRRKEISGVKAGSSRQRLNIPKGSIVQADFPVQFEDFYLISVGAIDLRPTYHDSNQIWPVGYRSMWHDKITRSLFVFDVTDGGDSGPNFSVRRFPCLKQTIPVGSTVISKKQLASSNGEKNTKKVVSSRIGTCDDDDSMSIQMLLTEDIPPCLDNSILLNGDRVVNPVKSNLGSGGVVSQLPGESSTNISEQFDSIGEFEVRGRSTSPVWENCCRIFLEACLEAYKRKGAIQFGCEHDCGNYVEEPDHHDILSKFSCSTGPIGTLHAINGDNEFRSACEQVRKWLQADRFGLDAEFVQEFIEQLPGATACSQYTPLIKRDGSTAPLTVRSGVLDAKRKRDDLDSDCYSGSSKRPRENSQPSSLRGPFPLGKPLSSKLPAFLIGDALQVWDFQGRFYEMLEQPKPFILQELEHELINPWSNGRNTLEKLGKAIHDSGDVSYRSSQEYSEATFSNSSCCMCTGVLLSKFHISLLEVLVGELLSKVAIHVDPNFDAGESKSRRGKKKDLEYSAMIKKMKLGVMPVNEVTWPELARRYILAVLAMECNLDSAEIAYRESGRVFHCLQGDGGTLCGSLTGVASLEADALLLTDAARKIFGPLAEKNATMITTQENSQAVGDCSNSSEMANGEVPEWVKVLEPVRKQATNVGARIRTRVNEALALNPPDWAIEKLKHSISKEIYKGNASGPTKRIVVSILDELNQQEKSSQQNPKPEKKEKPKRVISVSDLIMKQCRIVLRRAISADEDRVICNLLGKTCLNPSENDEEGLLGYPTMVSRPLDFRTIDLKLAAGAYCGSHEAFADDVREVWQNVRTAFREQPGVLDLAEKLSKEFEESYTNEVLTFVEKTMEAINNGGLNTENEDRDELIANATQTALPKVPWDEGLCKVCGMDKDDDNVLLCDGCDSEYHMYCLNPRLARIPEGNWYCPSCVSGQSVSQLAADSSRAVHRCGKGKQKHYIQSCSDKLVRLANRMESKEYWELTVDERIFLLKFLCDEALSSEILRDHIDHCASASIDLQQKMRSLNSERKTLRFREENLVMKAAKVNLTDKSESVVADDAQMLDINCREPKSQTDGLMEMLTSAVSDSNDQQPHRDHATRQEDHRDVEIHESDVVVSVEKRGDTSSSSVSAPSSSSNAELSNLQNEISSLRQSIDAVESELLRVLIRKEFLGRDSDGRLYWVFGRPGASPRVLVNINSNSQEKFGSESLNRNPTSWQSYNLDDEVKELIKWLNDGDTKDKELKDAILLWLNQKTVGASSTEPSLLQSTEKKTDLISNSLVTKAVKALEKKFGHCIVMQDGDDSHLYRCKCLELIWPSRLHCLSCHVSFSDDTEFKQHCSEKCRVLFTVPEGDVQTPRNTPSNHVEDIPDNDCPYNPEEIQERLKPENSLREDVKDTGLIRTNGEVPFVPNPSYMDDPALSLTGEKEDVVPSGSEHQRLPRNNVTNDKVTEVGKVKCLKPTLFNERGEPSSVSDPSLVFGISLNSLLRESSSRPKVGKASEILRCLKINLLDMEAALPDEALRSSRSSVERRAAWRNFVKSANTLYEMVQATIILEDTIKTEHLRNDWWYWSSPSAAVTNISTLSSLALRVYALDSAIFYEKPLGSEEDTPETAQKKGNNVDQAENPKPRTRTATSKRKKDSSS